MRKWSGILMLVVSILLLSLAGCQKNEQAKDEWSKSVTSSGEMEVAIKAYRYDSAWVSFPESEYTVDFTFHLGEDFTQLEDSDWWDRLHTAVEESYHAEREELEPHQYFIHEVPSVEWLKENIQHRGVSVYHMVEFTLPPEGRLQRKVEKESYDRYIGQYGHREEDVLDPVHLILGGGQELYSMRAIFEHGTKGTYTDTLEDVQKAIDGVLVFESPDKDYYAILHLPGELRMMEKEDLKLGQPYEATISAVVYTE